MLPEFIMTASFAKLFKKYRLKAEFQTISEFGNVLAEKGFRYDDSIFSHWQKGTRTPTERKLLLTIAEIFIERKAINSIDEVNQFLSSTGQGFLTKKEIFSLPFLSESVFQVPHEVADFTGREEIIETIKKEATQGKTILIYGQAGVGKTTLAIKLGHVLRYDFPDGILWYRLDTSNMKDIFISIAHMLGKILPQSKDIEILASFIRSVLAQKKVLLIFDNVEKNSNIHLLLPNASSSCLMILSRQKNLYLPANPTIISLESFKNNEVLTLFEHIFHKNYVTKNKNALLRLGEVVGNLPLAIHILASQLKQSELQPKELLQKVEQEHIYLENLSYENKNLFLTINLSYKNLSPKTQAVFLSLGVFEGKDFSVDAIAYMNGLKNEKAKTILDELFNASLIELSLNKKFRIHPMIKRFIGEKLHNPYLATLNKIIIIMFIFFTIFWFISQTRILSENLPQLFGATYFIIAFLGGIWGMNIAKRWGGIKSIMGKTILLFSLSLFCQTFGQVAYGIQHYLTGVEGPYPSVGDIGFFGTIPVTIYGIFLLAKVAGIKLNFSSLKNHIFIFLLSITVLSFGYILLLQNYIFEWSNPLKVFFDFAYPLGDSIYVYLAIITYLEVKKANKNSMKNKIIIFIISLFALFLSDYVFIYVSNRGTFHVGKIIDYMYLFSYLLMTLAILKLNSDLSKMIKN